MSKQIEEWCEKCMYDKERTPVTCKKCEDHEKSVIRIFGNPINYMPRDIMCQHESLEVTVVDTNVYDNNDTVIVTRQDVCEECGENVGETYDQVYTLIEDK